MRGSRLGSSISGSALTESEHNAAMHQAGGDDDLSGYYARLGAANAFTTGGHVITAESAGVKPFIVKGAAAQTVNLQEWQSSAGSPLASIAATGAFVVGNQGFRERTDIVGSLAGTLLQSQTADARSLLAFAPNGASRLADFWMFNTSDIVTNFERLIMGYNGSDNLWHIYSDAGGTGTVRGLRIGLSTSSLGFYGAVPVARGAAIAAADGTLADITTKFNSLLTYLRSRGDIAT